VVLIIILSRCDRLGDIWRCPELRLGGRWCVKLDVLPPPRAEMTGKEFKKIDWYDRRLRCTMARGVQQGRGVEVVWSPREEWCAGPQMVTSVTCEEGVGGE
jgi:hypothetical protein